MNEQFNLIERVVQLNFEPKEISPSLPQNGHTARSNYAPEDHKHIRRGQKCQNRLALPIQAMSPQGVSCHPRGISCHPRGCYVTPRGYHVTPRGISCHPRGCHVTPGGCHVTPGGYHVTPGDVMSPQGVSCHPRGCHVTPGGRHISTSRPPCQSPLVGPPQAVRASWIPSSNLASNPSNL